MNDILLSKIQMVKVFFAIYITSSAISVSFGMNSLLIWKNIALILLLILNYVIFPKIQFKNRHFAHYFGFFSLIIFVFISSIQGILLTNNITHMVGDAYKIIIFPLMFIFFYTSLSSKSDFLSVMRFIAIFTFFLAVIIFVLFLFGVVSELYYYLYSIPMAYFVFIHYNRKKITYLLILLFLCLTMFISRSLGQMISIIVFFAIIFLYESVKIKMSILVFVTLTLTTLFFSDLLHVRIDRKLDVLFSDYSLIYKIEYILAGRLTEFLSVPYLDNFFIGSGLGSVVEPVLIHDDMIKWYDLLVESVSHSMHSVVAEVPLRYGVLSLMIILAFIFDIIIRAYKLGLSEGRIIFAMGIMILQGFLMGQPLTDAFIIPSFLLAFLLKTNTSSYQARMC